jgi:hypothetical protein
MCDDIPLVVHWEFGALSYMTGSEEFEVIPTRSSLLAARIFEISKPTTLVRHYLFPHFHLA